MGVLTFIGLLDDVVVVVMRERHEVKNSNLSLISSIISISNSIIEFQPFLT